MTFRITERVLTPSDFVIYGTMNMFVYAKSGGLYVQGEDMKRSFGRILPIDNS